MVAKEEMRTKQRILMKAEMEKRNH